MVGSLPRTCRRVLVLLVVAGGVVLAWAAPAAAHASFVSASPGPGIGLPEAPGAVAMRFSEPLNQRLSRIEVIDGRGHDVGVGPTQAVARDPFAMRRKVGFLAPGQYTVAWLTVSTLDGHSLRGTYHFAIGSAADPATHVNTSPLASQGGFGLLGKWTALAGLGLWLGAALLAPVARRGGLDPRRLSALGRAAPAMTFVGTAVSVASLAFVTAGVPSGVVRVLIAGSSGHWLALELAAAAIGTAVRPGWRIGQILLAVLAVAAESASGHAASTRAPTVAAISISVQLASVGVWIFAILASVWAPSARRMLTTSWPYAAGAAVAVVATGTLNTVLELDHPGQLLSTGYGVTIVLKFELLAIMVVLGLVHHARRRRAAGADASVRRPVRFELLTAGLAVALATVLIGFPNPPRQAEAADRGTGPDVLVHLAGVQALSLATASGPFVIGLTVLPPRPGPVAFQVQVVGVDAGDGLGNARIALTGPDHRTGPRSALTPCGFGCFRGQGNIAGTGDWTFEVSMDSTRQKINAVFAAPMPTPDGTAALGQAIANQERLHSAAMREELRGTEYGPAAVADYRFSRGAFEIQIGGRDQIVIGSRSFDKAGPTSLWATSAWPGPPVTWPYGYFRDFWHLPAAARVLGTDQLDGTAMTVISFARPDLPAWFRIWVGVSDGLVHREQMRAEGHLIHHLYSDFNTSPPLLAPIPG